MSELPKSWTYTPLSNLLTRFEAGLNVKCEERPPGPGERGLVKISAVTWGRFDELQSKTLPSAEHPDPDRKIQIGDLLLSRANTLELVGASVIVEQLNRDLYLSDKVLRLVVHEPSKRWINYALKTPALRKAIGEASSGNQLSMRNISQDSLRQLLLPLAPEREQGRISDKLDTVLTRVDAVNTRLARVAPILKRFRQSVLAAAASGTLSADVNRGEWPQPVDLGAHCEVFGGKRLPKGSQLSEADTGFPYVRVTDFYSFGVKVDQVKFVPVEAVNTIARYIIRAVDVYISIAGSIGLVGRVPQTLDGANLTENAARIVVGPEVHPSFLMYQLGSPQLQSQMHEKKIATTQDKLGLFRIKALKVFIPPLIEQTEIVRRVETLFAFADRLEARLQTAQTATERLTPALLAKAFRGELVPQDPNDEPASELLKRLAASTPASTPKRGRPKVSTAA